MRYIFRFIIISAALAFVFGCSSSDSGGGSYESNVRSIIGIVVDPPVEGSRLELREMGAAAPANFCGVNRNTPCQAFTNTEGRFTFTADKTIDLSDYYIVTYGGVDTGYNTDLRGISFYSPLSLFNAGNDSVVVSPVTSLAASLILNESASVEDAVSKTESALGLAGVDIKANPMTNPSLIKASYLIVKAADLIYSEGAADPLAKIAEAVNNTNPTSLSDTAFISELITVSQITDTAVASAIEDEIVAIDALLSDSELEIPDPDALVQAILAQGSKRAFNEALKNTLSNFPSMPTSAYSDNATLLYELLTDNIEGLLPNQFAADQLLRFVIRTASFFGDYDNYIDPSFGTQLGALVPAADPQKTEFVDLLKAIAGENLYFVSAAISEPLGDNNTKRVDYYFRSNADKNYNARKILNTVFDDTITDTIANYIIDSYSLHGFHQKAKEIANYYIASTVNIILAYRSISYWTAVYDKVTAKEYLDLGKARLDATFQAYGSSIYLAANNSLLGNYITYYTRYMTAYDRAGDHETAQEIRESIVDMLSQFTTGTAGNQNTRWQSLLNSLGLNVGTTPSVINQFIADGDLENALLATDYYLRLARDEILISRTFAASNQISLTNLYRLQVYHSANAATYYRMLANDNNSAALKANVAAIKTSVDEYLTHTEIGPTSGNRDPLAYLAGPVYWAMGEAAADDIIAALASRTSRVFQAYYEIAIAIAEEEGFDSALAWYNGKNPIDANYSKLAGDYGIISAFTYLNSWDAGMGLRAHSHNRDDIAERAADYLLSELDNASQYFADNGWMDDNATVMLTAPDRLYPDYATYPINSDYEGGYLKVAQVYALIGDSAKTKTALQKAEEYADNLTYAYPRGKFYSLLGYYYLTVADDPAASEAAYAKAAAELANITGDDTRLNYNILLAYNTFYRAALTEDAKKNLVNGYLQSAVTLAESVFADGTYADNDEKDAAAEDTISLLLTIADRYASINDREKIRATLEKAESIIDDDITEGTTALAQKKLVYNAYAKLYSIDLAVRKAETLADLPDRNDALRMIATSIANTNDFPGTGSIAFSDTDKDGKPDFFVPWATPEQIAASGLELDDDIDGDGTPDTTDLTPFYAD
jgi:hypothetical protein